MWRVLASNRNGVHCGVSLLLRSSSSTLSGVGLASSMLKLTSVQQSTPHESSVHHVFCAAQPTAEGRRGGGGIGHSEMPEQKDGQLAGFQLWVNLPAAK